MSPNKSGSGDGYVGWAYCARTAAKDFFLLYFEKGCPRAALSGAIRGGHYRARWFNPRSGKWLDAPGGSLPADPQGKISLPPFPGGSKASQTDWGLSLVLIRDQ